MKRRFLRARTFNISNDTDDAPVASYTTSIGDCSGKGHECAGHNICAGKGHINLPKDVCLRIKGGHLKARKGEEG